MLGGVYPEPIRFALSKITRGLSFPRNRESSPFGLTWTPACAGVTTTPIFISLGGP